MEIWMWISLWIIQTLVGAVLWRKYKYDEQESIDKVILYNLAVIFNIMILIYLLFKCIGYLYKQLCYFIDYLAGVKNKTEE